MNNKNKISYKEYNDVLKDKYNIKLLILNKLRIPNSYEIKTLDDIALLIDRFTKEFPYCNIEFMNGEYRYDAEYIIESLLFDNKGGLCIHLNLLFGLLLYQYNIKIKLIKPYDKSDYHILEQFRFHSFNLIHFKDPGEGTVKKYTVDVSLGYFSSQRPVEIGNTTGVLSKTNKSYYRIINHDVDGSYIYQVKKTNDDEYTPLFQFSTKAVLHNEMIGITRNYSTFSTSIIVFKMCDDGIHIMNEHSYKIDYYNGEFIETPIQGLHQIKYYLINSFYLNPKLPVAKL